MRLFSDEIKNLLTEFGEMQMALRKAQAALKEERDRAQAIVSSMSEGVAVIDNNYKIILINPAASKLLQLENDLAIGKEWDGVVSLLIGNEELSFEEWLKSCSQNETPLTMGIAENFYFLNKRGEKFPVALSVSPLKLDHLSAFVIVFNDISSEKKLEEARVAFISLTSHQLRTPIISMKWFLEMLLNGDAGGLSKEQLNIVGEVYRASERMSNLLNLLLQIARVESRRVRIEPLPIDFKEITEKVMISLRPQLESRQQKVNVVTTSSRIPHIPMDYEIVWQVISNLLSNASRYSAPGNSIDIKIAFDPDKEEITYSVKDYGIGIPEEEGKRVFEKFFRTSNAVKYNPEGSGLGLNLVKMLVLEWGGRVWFESEEGRGATFYFTVPATGMKAKAGEVGLKV